MASAARERADLRGRLQALPNQVEQAQDGGQDAGPFLRGHHLIGVVHELLEESLLLGQRVDALDGEAGEPDDVSQRRGGRVEVGHPLLDRRAQQQVAAGETVDGLPLHLGHERPLRGEVRVDGADGGVDLCRQALHRQGVQALLGGDSQRRLEVVAMAKQPVALSSGGSEGFLGGLNHVQ